MKNLPTGLVPTWKWLWLWVLLFEGLDGRAQENSSPKQKVLALLATYSPESYEMVKAYYQAPSSYTFSKEGGSTNVTLGKPTDMEIYIDPSDEKSILKSLNTVVHEICHGYTSRVVYQELAAKNTNAALIREHFSLFYLSSESTVIVPHTAVFNSSEIHPSVPEELQTFRYATYIYPKSHLSSQVDGVYGLLDEWNAYYHGTRTAFELYPYYKIRASKQPDLWLDYFSEINSTYFAYQEFRYYILKYLIFAKLNYPEIYEEILNNTAFLEAFLGIDSNFENLINKYFALKHQIISGLKIEGHNAKEDGNYIFVGSKGVGNFLEAYHLLKEELGKKEYHDLLMEIRENIR